MRLLAAVTVVLWAGAAPGSARAAEEAEGASKRDDPKAAEARAHYEEGTKAYNLGEYPRAVTEFKAAYNAKPDPLLLYNIAQSFRLGGDAAQALFFYRSFLRNMPAAPNRKEVEGRIRTLERQVEKQTEEQKHEAAAPPAAVATPPAPSTIPPAPPQSTVPPAPGASPAPAAAQPPPAATTPPPASALPAAVEPVAPASAGVDVSRAPAEEPAPRSSPFYKKWWFWTGVGVVLLVGIGAAAARDKPPSTTYGLHTPKFTP